MYILLIYHVSHIYIHTHCIDFEDILTSPNVCCYSLTEQFNSICSIIFYSQLKVHVHILWMVSVQDAYNLVNRVVQVMKPDLLQQ